LFVVCDGHNGVTAAQYVADQLPAYLDDLLPPGAPPPESDAKAFLTWRQGLQRALTISLALLHRAFAGMGMLAGCTVTIVLQVRQLGSGDQRHSAVFRPLEEQPGVL